MLGAALRGHDGPVRCVCAAGNGVMTGAQDRFAKMWQVNEATGCDFEEGTSLVRPHSNTHALEVADLLVLMCRSPGCASSLITTTGMYIPRDLPFIVPRG